MIVAQQRVPIVDDLRAVGEAAVGIGAVRQEEFGDPSNPRKYHHVSLFSETLFWGPLAALWFGSWGFIS